MSWWCSSTRQVWDWTPRPYLGALIIVWTVLGVAGWWRQRGRYTSALGPDGTTAADGSASPGERQPVPAGKGRTTALVVGALLLWAVLDWPLATLGAGYLASAQMTRQIVMVLVVAPLLLFACPPELAVRAIGWGRRLRVLRIIARPWFGIGFAAVTLLTVNAPAVVDPLVASPFGAFVMDGMWVSAGFVLWMPVQCPHPGVRRLSGGAALVYLIGQSIVPVLPGFFMTWADLPIYRTYELAPRAIPGFDARTDQQAAAAILQIGGMVLIWIQISYRFLKWMITQMDESTAARKAMPKPTTTAP